jgi:hypothetical protein
MKNDSLLYKIIRYITYNNKPELLVSLGPKQAEYILTNYKSSPLATVLPCGVFTDYEKDIQIPEWKKEDGKIYFGYCGNLGAPHSKEFLKAFIDSFNPDTHHLILAVYGPKASEIQSYAKGKAGITMLKNVPRSQLHYIDIHLVSLLPEFNHTAVPSKAISSICTGGTVLFYGNEEADTWFMLQKASWLIDINKDLKNQLINFTENISPEEVESKKKESIILADQLYKMEITAYQVIADHIIRYYQ